MEETFLALRDRPCKETLQASAEKTVQTVKARKLSSLLPEDHRRHARLCGFTYKENRGDGFAGKLFPPRKFFSWTRSLSVFVIDRAEVEVLTKCQWNH
jgi:hypothetical protein